jgi:hypothetical protein
LDRPLGQQDVEAPKISRQLAYEGGKVVSNSKKIEENSEHVVFNNAVYHVMCVITRTTHYGIN